MCARSLCTTSPGLAPYLDARASRVWLYPGALHLCPCMPQRVLHLKLAAWVCCCARSAELDEDVPGLGRHYCIPCARYFQDAASLVDHEKSKPHKKRWGCTAGMDVSNTVHKVKNDAPEQGWVMQCSLPASWLMRGASPTRRGGQCGGGEANVCAVCARVRMWGAQKTAHAPRGGDEARVCAVCARARMWGAQKTQHMPHLEIMVGFAVGESLVPTVAMRQGGCSVQALQGESVVGGCAGRPRRGCSCLLP